MKTKKLISIFLAAVLALALAVPAFAAGATQDIEASQGSLQVNGSTKAPAIKVNIPAAGNAGVIVNPYGMTVDVDASVGNVKGNAQIISATYYAVNLTDANVKVGIKVTGATGGSLVYTDKPVASQKGVTSKMVFLYMDTKVVAKNGEKVTWSGTYDKANTMQALVTNAVTPGEIKVDKNTHYVLEAAKDASAGSIGTGGVLAFTFGGDANGNPTEAWTAADTPTITINFTFDVTSDPSTYSVQQAAG